MEELPKEKQNLEPKVEKKLTLKTLLSNRRNVLIGALAIIALLLVFFAVFAGRLSKNLSPINSKADLTTPQAVIFFDPANVNIKAGKSYSAGIYLDTYGKAISGANISIHYNPNVMTNVTLVQFRDNTSPISLAFQNAAATNDTVNGLIELPLQMAATTPEQKGRGRVATLFFIPKKININQTSFDFSPSTALITRIPQNTIVLQKNTLILYYPIDGVYPTLPQLYK